MGVLPYMTDGLPGIGGRIKDRAEDFRVEEIAPDGPAGRGRFAWFRLTKRGLTTRHAARRIAAYMGVGVERIGLAGLKDTHAVTSQWMSLAEADVDRLARFRDREIRVSDVHWRPVPLELGRLAGNRFVVRVRGVGPERLADAQAVLEVLCRRGVPNYFGPQRFGPRGDNAALGTALVRGDLEEFLRVFLGRPWDGDPPRSRAAREAFDGGALPRALRCWAGHCVDPRNALAALLKGKRPRGAVEAVSPHVRQMHLLAYQSEVFNEILARRIGGIDRVEPGDLAEDHATGRCFVSRDLPAAARRAAAFEISPTGLLPGREMRLAEDEPGRIEQAVLAERGIDAKLFARRGAARVKGARRALRYRPGEAAASAGRDRSGPYVEVAFTAPPGCYATVLLEELCKDRRPYTR
ncbi:MAG TPA: tRNA pseudouridine(13) synthase TruD [Phycisphaerae bacterium]|nr:tRNA pseudouridine(13) synthase TruD [Phycisphaerae bacterium]